MPEDALQPKGERLAALLEQVRLKLSDEVLARQLGHNEVAVLGFGLLGVERFAELDKVRVALEGADGRSLYLNKNQTSRAELMSAMTMEARREEEEGADLVRDELELVDDIATRLARLHREEGADGALQIGSGGISPGRTRRLESQLAGGSAHDL